MQKKFIKAWRCVKCQQLKPTSDFRVLAPRVGQKVTRVCKACSIPKPKSRPKAPSQQRVRGRPPKYPELSGLSRAEYLRRWRSANPEKARRHHLDYRAREVEAEGEHTAAEIFQMYEDQQGLCAYCETPLFGSYHVDHMMPLSRGGANDWTNLAIACSQCNTSKGAKTAVEFVANLTSR